jgi:hypothetical protein
MTNVHFDPEFAVDELDGWDCSSGSRMITSGAKGVIPQPMSEDNTNVQDQAIVEPPAPPPHILLTLCWIDSLLAADDDVARAAIKDDFPVELTKLHCMLEMRAFGEAVAALDIVLERFALVQCIAFKNRGSLD